MKTGNHYQENLQYFLRSGRYMAAVLFTAVLCFGASAVHTVISVDSLEGSRYIGDGAIMLANGRFGMNLIAAVLGYGYAEPADQFYIKVVAAALLVLAALHFCVLFRRVAGERISLFGYGIFSCLLISYPLMNEIWEYSGANACVCAGYLLAAVALYLQYDGLHTAGLSRRGRILRFVGAALALMVICSSYESLAVVYVFGVLAVLSLQLLQEKTLGFGGVIRRGLWYAAAPAAGIVLRLVIHRVILLVCGLSFYKAGDTGIYWGTAPFSDIFKSVVKECILQYGMRGCFYLPIGELAAAAAVFTVLLVATVVRRRRPLLLLTGGGMLFCLVLLSALQGKCAPYRTCQVFALMVACTALWVYEGVRRLDKRWLTRVLGLLLVLLCLRQAACLSRLLALDQIRSDEEGAVVQTIGTDLERGDYDLSKPVVVVGSYTLSQDLLRQVTVRAEDNAFYHWFQTTTRWETEPEFKYLDSNVNSVIDWAIDAFSETGVAETSMQKLFAYYGFDFTFVSDLDRKAAAEEYAVTADLPSYPENGYIVEQEDCILVHLQ